MMAAALLLVGAHLVLRATATVFPAPPPTDPAAWWSLLTDGDAVAGAAAGSLPGPVHAFGAATHLGATALLWWCTSIAIGAAVARRWGSPDLVTTLGRLLPPPTRALLGLAAVTGTGLTIGLTSPLAGDLPAEAAPSPPDNPVSPPAAPPLVALPLVSPLVMPPLVTPPDPLASAPPPPPPLRPAPPPATPEGPTPASPPPLRRARPTEDATETWVVEPGEHLWRIAEATLAERQGSPPSAAQTARFLHRLVAANRAVLVDPDDPDLILPGQVFTLPAGT